MGLSLTYTVTSYVHHTDTVLQVRDDTPPKQPQFQGSLNLARRPCLCLLHLLVLLGRVVASWAALTLPALQRWEMSSSFTLP